MLKLYSYLPKAAYSPESYAIASYLRERGGVSLELIESEYNPVDECNYDGHFVRMGFRPFWRQGSIPEIHDYASSSTGRNFRIKNFVKRHAAVKPVLRSFLSPYVRDAYGFRDGTPYVLRDMGVPEEYFGAAVGGVKEFDLFYAGSITLSRGTDRLIDSAVRSGRSLLLVGEPEALILEWYRGVPGVTFAGKVARDQIPVLASSCRFGINFTPAVPPFDAQSSTKILEYLAMGLPVITNEYQWVREFENESGARMFKLDEHLSMGKLEEFEFSVPDMGRYRWSAVLERSNLYEAITTLLGSS